MPEIGKSLVQRATAALLALADRRDVRLKELPGLLRDMEDAARGLSRMAGFLAALDGDGKAKLEDLPKLVAELETGLQGLSRPAVSTVTRRQGRKASATEPKETASPGSGSRPAVPIEQSVTPDYIVCLEDGRKVKLLGRYLKSKFRLTADAYRERWGLPQNYPMVAPAYALAQRAIGEKGAQVSSGRGRRAAG